jgi:hypothetical protein
MKQIDKIYFEIRSMPSYQATFFFLQYNCKTDYSIRGK